MQTTDPPAATRSPTESYLKLATTDSQAQGEAAPGTKAADEEAPRWWCLGKSAWSFWQDLSQLKHLYPDDWQTMINNCEVLQAFGFANAAVARDGADLTGFSNWRLLQDLEADEMVLAIAGDEAVIARRPNYLTDPAFAGQFDANAYHQTVDAKRSDQNIRRYVRSGDVRRFEIEPDGLDGRTRIALRDAQTLRESLALLEYYWKEARPELNGAGDGLPAGLAVSEPHEAIITLLRKALNDATG